MDKDNNNTKLTLASEQDETAELTPPLEKVDGTEPLTPNGVDEAKLTGKKRVLAKVKRYGMIVLKVVLLIAFTVYFGFVMKVNFGNNYGTKVLVFACIIYLRLLLKYVPKIAPIRKCWQRMMTRLKAGDLHCCKVTKKMKKIAKICLYSVACAACVAIIVLCAVKSPYNLVSVGGILVMVGACYPISRHRKQIAWYPVIVGIVVQFLLGILTLNVPFINTALIWVGDEINNLIDFYKEGSMYVFGASYTDHYFAFGLAGLIIYFGAMLSVLNYLGVLQAVSFGIASALRAVFRTAPAESVVAGASVFLGGITGVMIVKPCMPEVTLAEIYVMIAASMGTAAGPALGMYAQYGIPMHHLIIASVMSVPASVGISRLLCPETKKSPITPERIKQRPKGEFTNIVDALQTGALSMLSLIGSVIANLLVFTSVLKLLNASLIWICKAAGINKEVTFDFLCSYLLWPVALIQGVSLQDCHKFGELLGVKLFTNELVAYSQLGVIKQNSVIYSGYNGTVEIQNDKYFLVDRNVTLVGGVFHNYRSFVIATYALCGSTSVGMIGILVGGLSALAPNRSADITKLAFHAWIAANVACLMTACVAGTLYEPDPNYAFKLD